MQIYNIIFVYDNFSIITTEEHSTEDYAIECAIENLRYELGSVVDDYNSIEVMACD